MTDLRGRGVAFIRSSKRVQTIALPRPGRTRKVAEGSTGEGGVEFASNHDGARTWMSPNRQKAGHPEMTPELEINYEESIIRFAGALHFLCSRRVWTS